MAERLAADADATERVGYLDEPGGSIFAATVTPRTGGRGGAIFCPSIMNDFVRTYRSEVNVGRALAQQGIPVRRFHYRGTGHSDGDPALTGRESMVEDADRMARHFVEEHGLERLAIVGTRFGALVAAELAEHHPDAPVILVEPSLDAPAFFRSGFRARRAAEVAAGDEKDERDLEAELVAAGKIELLGQTIHSRLYESWSGVKVGDLLERSPRRVLLIQLDRPAELRPEYRRLVARLEAAGGDVSARPLVSPESWWFLSDDDRPEHTYGGLLVDWLRECFAREGVG
jgi:pimeloyl-ACP methyl ester carboxylesterase